MRVLKFLIIGSGALIALVVLIAQAQMLPPVLDHGSSRNACGTYPGRLHYEALRHEFIQGFKGFQRSRGDLQEQLWATEDSDEDHIAIIEDDGSIVADPNPLDLAGKTLRFEPTAFSRFNVTVRASTLGTDLGSAIALGDDTTYKAVFPSGFTFSFYGTNYQEAYVNSNGNLTFGKGDAQGGIDIGIYGRELADFLNGPPRIAALFADLTPGPGGGIFIKSQSDRLTMTWSRVRLFGNAAVNTFQIILFSNGAVELVYSEAFGALGGYVGISPGGSNATLTAVDFTRGPLTGLSGAIIERFNTQTEIDLLALAKKFYQSHRDTFEFLSVFSDFNLDSGQYPAYEINVSNSAKGLGDILGNGPGQDIFDESRLFGSEGRLESLVMLGPLANYPSNPEQIFHAASSTLALIGEQVGHRWGAYVYARIGGRRSDRLLGRQLAHWSFFHDTDASVLEGNKIRDNGNGTFTTIEATRRYSQLDQYLMGLRDAAEVAPFFIVESPTGTNVIASDAPAPGVTFGGTRRNVTVQDVIAEEGLREPTAATSPKIFHMAFVLLVRRGTQPAQAALDKIKTIRTAWEKHFAQATAYRGFMDTRLVYNERPLVTYFPLNEGDAQRFTGIAAVNEAPYPVSAKFTMYGDDGKILQLPGIVNPVTLALGPGQQTALLDSQIFRFASSESRQGWIKIESSSDRFGAFFMVGNNAQTYLDGGLGWRQAISHLVFSRVYEGNNVLFGQPVTTEINLVNPNAVAAEMQCLLYDGSGRATASAFLTIPPGNRIRKTLAQLFAALPLPVSSGYLEVLSKQPLLGFELIQFKETLFGLPAQAVVNSRSLYLAQFASGGLGYYPVPFFTDLNLVNVSDEAANVIIRIVEDDGRLLQLPGVSNPLVSTIPSRGTLNGRADQLFGLPRDETDTVVREGSIIVDIAGGAVLGDATFGAATSGQIMAAVPLQSTLLSDSIFSQVAEGRAGVSPISYFTGVAVFNPYPVAVQLTIEAYKETGELAGTKNLILMPSSRFSQTIAELIPAAAGQMRGYMRVRTAGGSVALLALFGDSGLSRFLSAIPPQAIN